MLIQREVLQPIPPRVEAVSHVHNSLLHASRDVLRRHGHYARYLAMLNPSCRDILLEPTAPDWLPFEVADAHYAACEGLHLAEAELRIIGDEVGQRIQGTFLGASVRASWNTTGNPWSSLFQVGRLWSSLIQGGAVGLSRHGAKNCTVELRELPLLSRKYFRTAYCGLFASGVEFGGGESVLVWIGNSGNWGHRCLLHCAWD